MCKNTLRNIIIVTAAITGLIFIRAFPCISEVKPVYLNSAMPIDVRVDDLLSRMTIEEKIGQMNIPCAYKKRIGWGMNVGEISMHTKLSPEIREKQKEGARKYAAGTWDDSIGPGGGFFTLSDRCIYEGTLKQAEFLNELQKIAVEETRLKIPLLQIEEGTHGLMCSGATIFPEGLSIGSTWNMDLVEEIYATAAREGRSIGVHALCTLVVEPNRDPRLGRNEEGYSECPFLCSRISESLVQGIQGNDVSANDKLVAALSHYPGQSEPAGGMERGAMHVSERKLREVFLPPWEAGIKDAGALCLMATYPAINGIAVHNSSWILTKLLREELGFDGVVLSEGRGISTLIDERVVSTQKAAGQRAVKAGIDVGISFEDAYLLELLESVREGSISMETIDRAVSRILRLKFMLGLFENPYVEPKGAVRIVHTKEHQNLALQAAREGIVLLKNENGLLPLKKTIGSIAVIGPNADTVRNQLGDYSPFNIITEVTTVLEGVRKKVSSGTEVEYVKGCDVMGDETDEIAEAKTIAGRCDVAVVVVGESDKTNGEGRDVADLDLTGRQKELVKAVQETGTPTVVVLINGRPLSIRWISENIPAIIEAWNCGEKGGEAVADVLFGDYNPSGRLPITVPRHVGQLPVYYNHSPTKEARMKGGYVNMSAKPLYEFGYGLSYTDFEYTKLLISPETIKPGGTVSITVDVANTGSRAGQEVVQLYINDVLSSVTTPVKELRGFEKIMLKPGEKKTVSFTLGPKHLSLLDRHLNRIVEPGTFEIMVGHSSKDIRQKGTFNVRD